MQRIRLCVFALGASLLACGDDASAPPAQTAGAPAAGAPAPMAEQPSTITPSCVPPPDCMPIAGSFVNLGVCCSETLRCGFDLSILLPVLPMLTNVDPSQLNFDPARPCTPRASVFLDAPGLSEQRVKTDGGSDILTTPACRSRIFVNTQLAGCCLPSDECGYSTHLAASAFRVLSGSSEYPFTKNECVPASELNAQLMRSTLAAWGHVPDAAGSCDHAAIAARTQK